MKKSVGNRDQRKDEENDANCMAECVRRSAVVLDGEKCGTTSKFLEVLPDEYSSKRVTTKFVQKTPGYSRILAAIWAGTRVPV